MRPERHHSNQGLYATRSSTPAPGSPSTHLTDAATARGSMPPVSALQPSFRPVLQPKHPRPVSRDPGNSAWPAPQHADPGQNLLHGTRQLSANRPSSNAASRALTSTQHALRRNTASQAVHIQQPASSQRQHSARPASSHRLNSANRHTTCEYVQSRLCSPPCSCSSLLLTCSASTMYQQVR